MCPGSSGSSVSSVEIMGSDSVTRSSNVVTTGSGVHRENVLPPIPS